ncbi:Predicted metal-dependent phosphohydrolase, HD superfamily [Tenacibaculum sp. MAR_2009_124]|uniref:Pycsar system effector family protein n=1 Tax=Tenacibaculum sp. MAR_2009_124 TaxID=1250059 RepID=UPI000899B6F2|nr:Pycsar system effector family protein [Tenacibaculum sp. MAR_2009_124]SED17411.1 Predicted metal-dependent phosphohydrolase, HD superfamily [Tenacibaculum sp. MAR_2009_124]
MSIFLEKAENYALDYLNNNLEKKFVYHSIAHTQRVVEKAKELGELEKIEGEDLEALVISAWFHDTGYSKSLKIHEEESVSIASEFLTKQGKDNLIPKVSEAILATRMSAIPESLLGKILRDADSSHLGSKNYDEFSALLRKELELTKGINFTDSEWIANNINFLSSGHQFYTKSAIKSWEKQKGKNLAQLLKSEKKVNQELSKMKQKKEELALKKNKIELPERGIETMFRVALRNHITLSDIADTKANILLSVNAIIISMALSTLIPKLDNPSNSYLIIPSIIFIIFTVVSIVLSILATRPNITQGKFTKDDVAQKKVNLIFFGNFHKMSLSEFEWAMDEMLKDRDYLYGSLTKDLYFLGLVLNRKYNILRTTYTVFMIGIIVSVIAFAVAFYNQGHVIPRV